MINKFISEICDILKIEVPEVSFDTSNFTTDTMLAQCSQDGSTIYLKYGKPNPDQFFAISHELRHVWQLKNNKQLYFSNYKPVELCESVEAYNLQPAEIDANAFAGVIMSEFFHLKPLFKGIPDSVKYKILDHMAYFDLPE